MIDVDGQSLGEVKLDEALARSQQLKLDLVEINPNKKPPVCRIMDYSRHVFESKKKRASSAGKQKQGQIKELKVRPGTDVHDINVKVKSLTKFLEKGSKVRLVMRFRGREVLHQELGVKLLDDIVAKVADIATVEQEAKLEGRQMFMVLAPKRSK